MLPRIVATLLGLIIILPVPGMAVIHQIDITGFDFSPGNMTINQGDTVNWTNLDAFLHTSTSDGGLWNSGNLANGQSYQRPFSSAGTFPYHCAIHLSMKDTLTVISAPTFDYEISIGDNFFNPAVIRINVGQTIRWTNNGLMDHTSTAVGGLWDSGALAPGEFFDFTFTGEGVYDYVCSFHAGMNGTVIVGRPDSVVADIDIVNMAFDPADLGITVGQYVRWINFDGVAHTTTANGGEWDSGNLEPGDVFIFHANNFGTFDYICSYHPAMTGVLRVNPMADYMIDMHDNYFDPAVIQISPGQTVRWMNMGIVNHTTTSSGGFWDSGSMAPGAEFYYTFPTEGVFDYFCSFHAGMNGTVIVGKPDSVAFDIMIIDNGFVPAETSITMGENVRWINFGAMAHTSTDTSENYWNSGNLNPGDVFTLHGGAAGVYHYICSYHPGMAGTFSIIDTTTGGGCAYVPGDINGNGQANGIDIGYGVNYFKGGPVPPITCPTCPQTPPFYAAGDVNGNCSFNGIDISFYVNYLKGIQPALQFCPSCPPAGTPATASKSGQALKRVELDR